MNLAKEIDMYNQYDFINNLTDFNLVTNNKLFCTFTPIGELDTLLNNITSRYSILYKKIFILKVLSNDEYVCTYNIENGNVSDIIDNTILVHRKKETNTLYTINALNELIKSLNGNVLDNNYRVNWVDYRNTILLTQQGQIKELKTKIFKIIEL